MTTFKRRLRRLQALHPPGRHQRISCTLPGVVGLTRYDRSGVLIYKQGLSKEDVDGLIETILANHGITTLAALPANGR